MVSMRSARVAVAAAGFLLLARAGVYALPAADSFNPEALNHSLRARDYVIEAAGPGSHRAAGVAALAIAHQTA